MVMTAGPNEGDAYSEEGLDPYPDVDPYAQAEADAVAAEQVEQDELLIEADRANALADETRGGGPKQIGDILRPAVDELLREETEQK